MTRIGFPQRLGALVFSALAVALVAGPALAQEAPGGSATSPRREEAPRSDGFTPFWVATHSDAALWSGAEAAAARLGSAPAGSPLLVVGPQEYARLLVHNPMTENVAWVDPSAVGPIPAPSREQLAAMLAAATAPPAFEAWWAMNHLPTNAWSGVGDDAIAWREIPQWRYLQVLQPPEAGRVLTVDPRTNGYAYVDVRAIGAVGPPPDAYFAPPPPDDAALSLPGRIVGAPDSYDRPTRADHFSLARWAHNAPIGVEGVVENGDQGRWYRIGAAEYVAAERVRLPREPARTWPGRWIDADLREPVMVTAYEGDKAVYSALAVKGLRAFQTPPGVFRITRRVANETMDSATIGIPRTSPLGYYLKDVLFTQYFTGDGAALHYNYWRSDFGYAGSKGCLGFNYDDSKFFWDFASVGTIVWVHN